MGELENKTKDVPSHKLFSFTFKVQFKENSFECFLGKFQKQYGSQCVDLITICRTFMVDVDVWCPYYTYNYFELFLSCNRVGKITRNEHFEMQTYKCNKCGGKRPFSKFEKRYSCTRCNNEGLENWRKVR